MIFFHTVITTRISRVPLTFNRDIGFVWIADGIGNRRTFSTLAEIYFSFCVKTTFLDIFRLNAISLEGEKKYFFVFGLNPNVLILTWRQKQKGLPLSSSPSTNAALTLQVVSHLSVRKRWWWWYRCLAVVVKEAVAVATAFASTKRSPS